MNCSTNLINRNLCRKVMFKIIACDNNARYGRLRTAHGTIETPCFMPVATKGVGKFIGTDDYAGIGAQAIICNAFLLSLNPGLEGIKKAGGLHRFVGFNRAIFTDCGGFQMLRQSLLNNVCERGIVFKHPQTKEKLLLTPEGIMQIQNSLSSDVAMGLDCVLPYGQKEEQFRDALRLTHKWMGECRRAHANKKQMLFGIVQGGTFPDLRKKSAEFIEGLNFDGNAVGGLAIGEPAHMTYKIINESNRILSMEKPRYVMGLGEPLQVLECIERGIDIFDSIYPTKNARHGMLFTFDGVVSIRRSIYRKDRKPVEEDCDCTVCKIFSRAYLRYLYKMDSSAGKRYMSIHNLRFMQKLVNKARLAIKEGRFARFKREIKRKLDIRRVDIG